MRQLITHFWRNKAESGPIQVGSTVRVIGVPDGPEDFPDMPTKSTFERCVGNEFVIDGFDGAGRASLDICAITGNPSEKICIGTHFLELVSEPE